MFIQLLIITISLNNRYTNININIYYIYKPNISRGKKKWQLYFNIRYRQSVNISV